MWTYHSDTGVLEHNGVVIGRGYSGHAPNGRSVPPDGINNPLLEADPNVVRSRVGDIRSANSLTIGEGSDCR